MDVDPSLLVRPLTHHPRNKRDLQTDQLMSDSVDRYGLEPREAKNDFVAVPYARIPCECSLHILG